MADPRFDPAGYPELAKLIEGLKGLSGDSAFRSGREYLRSAQVTETTVSWPIANAIVIGTTEYRVTVTVQREVTTSCTCPAHRRNRFCKHVVAVCLALNEKPELFTIVERVAPPPQPKATRRVRSDGTVKQRQAAQRQRQQEAGLEMVDRLLAELAGGGLAALGREGAALVAGAAETVRALKLRRLGNLLVQLQRLTSSESEDPRRFAAILMELWLVRRALAANQDGRVKLEPWLTEELLGKTWRDRDLERVAGLDLLPLADIRADDGEFLIETTYFGDLEHGEILCERVISPLAIRATRKLARRHRLLVEDAGYYPGESPRRIKLFASQPTATGLDDVSRLLRHGISDVGRLRRDLVGRLGVPFAAPELATIFLPAALLSRGTTIGAVDSQHRFLPLELPEAWQRDLPHILPEPGHYGLFGTVRLADGGPVLRCHSIVGELDWERGPVFPDRT